MYFGKLNFQKLHIDYIIKHYYYDDNTNFQI